MLNIYVDGSYRLSEHNGMCGGIGLYFGDNHPCNLSGVIISENATSGRLELIALYVALVVTDDIKRITIYSDSKHVVDPLTSKYSEYVSNGWQTKKKIYLADYDLFRECASVIEDRRQRGHKIKIKKVIAHAGVKGNEMADKFAGYASTSSGNEDGYITSTIVIDNNIRDSIKSHSIITNMSCILRDGDSIGHLATGTDNVEDTGHLSDEEFWSKPLSLQNTSTNSSHKQNYIFLLCIREGCMICINYPADYSYDLVNGIGNLSESTIMVTVCRSCLLNDAQPNSKVSLSNLANDMKNTMNKIKISKSIIQTSNYETCAKAISGIDQTVFGNGNYVECVSITEISMKFGSDCMAMSIDVDNNVALPYLKLGFL